MKYSPINYWIKDLGLQARDKKLLLEGGWIEDNVMTAAQSLLKDAYPHIGDLQPTVFGETLAFEVQRRNFVQVLNVYTAILRIKLLQFFSLLTRNLLR